MKIKDVINKLKVLDDAINELHNSITSLKELTNTDVLNIAIESLEDKLKVKIKEHEEYLNQKVLIGRDIDNMRSSYEQSRLWDK